MQNLLKPTTIYFQADVKTRLQHLAIEKGLSLSRLVNNELKKTLEIDEEAVRVKKPARRSRDPLLVAFLESQGMPVPETLYY